MTFGIAVYGLVCLAVGAAGGAVALALCLAAARGDKAD